MYFSLVSLAFVPKSHSFSPPSSSSFPQFAACTAETRSGSDTLRG